MPGLFRVGLFDISGKRHFLLFFFSFLAIICLLLSVNGVVLLVKRIRKAAAVSLLVIGIIAAIISLGYVHRAAFEDVGTHTVKPELCATTETTAGVNIHVYYKICRWPFTFQSFYQIDNWSQDAEMHEWLHTVISDPEKYTYIVSYGWKISTVTYNFENAANQLCYPWYGLVADPDFGYGEEAPGYVFVYRIPAVAIDTIG